MAEKELGIHIRNRVVSVREIVAVDMTGGLHKNVRHSHKNVYELIYCAEGHMVVQIKEIWTDMNAGSCVIIPKDTQHNTVTETDSTQCYYIAFVTDDDISAYTARYIHLPENYQRLLSSLTEAFTYGYTDVAKRSNVNTLIPMEESPFGMEQLSIDLLEILLVLVARKIIEGGDSYSFQTHDEKAESMAESSTGYISRQVTEYIKDHFRENLTVEQIANRFGYSRSRLSSLYKKETGAGINETINTQKLLIARNLLIETDMEVSEIAKYLGYSSIQYFTNRFTKSTGMSPSNYAKFKRTKVN